MSDIEQHCVSLIIKRIVGCDDDKAIEAAAMIDRYYTAPGATTKSDGPTPQSQPVATDQLAGANTANGPSDPTPSADPVAYLPFDAPLWKQHEHRIKRLMTDLGTPNSTSLKLAMDQLIRDVEYINAGRDRPAGSATAMARALLDQFEIRRRP